MGDDRLVSIVINNYNYARFLREAIDSALAQTYPHREVIVVDDGSTDDSLAVIGEYAGRVTLLRKENGGQASAFNAGFGQSRGDVVIFLDADDMLLPSAVEEAMHHMGRSDAKVHWPLRVMDAQSRDTGDLLPAAPLPEGDLRERLIREGPDSYLTSPTSGNAWSRHFLAQVLPAPQAEYRQGADGYLLNLAPLFGPIRRVAVALGRYRVHGANQFWCDAVDERVARSLCRYEQRCCTLSAFLRGQGIDADADLWRRRNPYYQWLSRLRDATAALKAVIPAGATFILVDDCQWGGPPLTGRRAIPFLERDGTYWGPPPDDATAIQESERLRASGARFLVFAWPAFWWLDHYTGFRRFLKTRFTCLLRGEDVVVFDLNGAADTIQPPALDAPNVVLEPTTADRSAPEPDMRRTAVDRCRALYIVHHFPQISETYIRSEIEAVQPECDVRVISLRPADLAYKNHVPFVLTDDPVAIRAEIEEFRPHVLHTHWLNQVPTLAYFAGALATSPARSAIPFTVRAHSFDTLGADEAFLRKLAPILNSDLCLGVLSFPFSRPILEGAGVRGDKLTDCYPVVNFERFHDPSPNGEAVMNLGACLPKKQMEGFLKLATMFPGREFNLYAMGYKIGALAKVNECAGSPVRFVPPVEPEAMRAEYKKHEWLVYTAAPGMNTVGWPMAVAEAQAAGVGVCLPNLRPDLRDYVGPAGFLYDSIAQAAAIIARPFPDDLRQAGFEHAKKSDVGRHKEFLLRLWRQAHAAAPGARADAVAHGVQNGYGDVALVAEWEWRERYHHAMRDLAACIPAGAPFLLADDGVFGAALPPGLSAAPFPQSNGTYAGPPADDRGAIQELERLRGTGARYLALGWPAFWWLEHYPQFHSTLRTNFPCVLENDRLIIFDLRPR